MMKYKTVTMAEVMGMVAEADHTKPSGKELYHYWVKKIMEAVVLGLTPGDQEFRQQCHVVKVGRLFWIKIAEIVKLSTCNNRL